MPSLSPSAGQYALASTHDSYLFDSLGRAYYSANLQSLLGARISSDVGIGIIINPTWPFYFEEIICILAKYSAHVTEGAMSRTSHTSITTPANRYEQHFMVDLSFHVHAY